MKYPLRLCIAGCGYIARRHADSAKAIGSNRVELSFASRSIDRARQYCEEFKASNYFGSYEQAASDPNVDAILFCTPHDRHVADVKLAASHGKAAIIEKPIARTMAEADEMIAIAASFGTRLFIAENYPYKVPVGSVRRMVRSGALGDLRHIEITYTRYNEPKDWRLDANRMGGGAAIDGGIHLISSLTNIAGDVESVFAMAPPRTVAMQGEDSIAAQIRLRSGAIGQLLYSWAVPPAKPLQRLSAYGTKGSVHTDLSLGTVSHISDQGEKEWKADSDVMGATSMLADFVEALVTANEPMLTAWECRRDLAVVLACYESMRTGNATSPLV